MNFAAAPVLGALIGIVVLLFGRRLFWLCVAALGFAAGVELAPHLVQQPSAVLQLTFALILGFAGALLALFLQKIAIGIVGFAAGGRLAVALTATFFVNYASYYWLTFIVGGVLGAILLIAVFDWTLIFVSSLLGAYLIIRALPFAETGATILVLALTIVGVLVQGSVYRRARTPAD